MSKPVQFRFKQANLCLKNTETEKFRTLFDKVAAMTQKDIPGFRPIPSLGTPASEVGNPQPNEPMSSSITDNSKSVPGSPGLPSTGKDVAHTAASNPIQGKGVVVPNQTQKITQIPGGRLAKPFGKMAGYARNTGVVDADGNIYVNSEDVDLLGKLGFDISCYSELEKTSEVLDLYSYIEKVAGIPKEVAKLIDENKAFSGEYLKDMDHNVPEGYEMKGDLCCPVEKKAGEKPGLWDNIRAKKARGEKAAKPGDEDYPDKKQWDKLSKESAASPAWQRSEGKNPAGGLNAKGRASYKRETGGTLKAPVTESAPKGERAKRQNSFCSRMCGMKSKNTGSKAQGDPDSRINKSLRKWNCKCGEDHTSLYEKIACTVKEAKGRCWEGYEPVPGKDPYSEDSCRPKIEKKEKKADLANTNSAMSLQANPILKANTINIPTENLAQRDNKPSWGTIMSKTFGGTNNPTTIADKTIETGKFLPLIARKLAPIGNIAKKLAPGSGTVAGAVGAKGRIDSGDRLGAFIDTAGGIGSAMETNPITAIPGAALNMGATGLNIARDFSKAVADTPGAPYYSESQSNNINAPIKAPVLPKIDFRALSNIPKENINQTVASSVKQAAKKIPKLQQLLPGMEEWVKKQPFNHAEELFRQGHINAAHRDKWVSGKMADEYRPRFEEILRILREGPPSS